MVTWKLVGWLRTALTSVLALAPLAAQQRAAGRRAARDRRAAPSTSTATGAPIASAGRDTTTPSGSTCRSPAPGAPGRVRAALDDARGARGRGRRWSVSAADLDGDGKMDVLVRDSRGRTTAWLSDGLAFTASPAPAPAMGPVAMLCPR